MCSVQLIFSVLRHIHISKASILLMFSFLRVHVSAQYKVTLQISVFIILLMRHLFNPPLSNSFLQEKASFPIVILLLISLWHLASKEYYCVNYSFNRRNIDRQTATRRHDELAYMH